MRAAATSPAEALRYDASMALRDHYEWLIGTRYLRSGQRRGFLSFISFISMMGLMLGVAVLVVVMSVMNGFEAELRTRIPVAPRTPR